MPLRVVTLVSVCTLLLTSCGGGRDDGYEPWREVTRDESGQVTGEGSIDVLALLVGDCFNHSVLESAVDDENVFASLDVVPCSSPHDKEVFANYDYPTGSDTAFPGKDVLFEFGKNECLTAFNAFVGIEWESSDLNYAWFSPTQSSWSVGGDREILCVLWQIGGEKLQGSMHGSGR